MYFFCFVSKYLPNWKLLFHIPSKQDIHLKIAFSMYLLILWTLALLTLHNLMWCIFKTLTFGDILAVRSRKSHLRVELRTLQMTSGLWYTERSLRLWSVISQDFPVLGRRIQREWLTQRLDILMVADMKEWQESALQHRLHKSFFKGEISHQVKPKQTNVKCIKLFKALNLFRVPNVGPILLILRAR